MIHDVVSASYKDGYKIEVTFDDASSGIVDFSMYLTRGGVFDRFNDINFFKTFKINAELGVLSWQNEIDIAPETLYAAATRTFYRQLTSDGATFWNSGDTILNSSIRETIGGTRLDHVPPLTRTSPTIRDSALQYLQFSFFMMSCVPFSRCV
jgi:hypothetical protein